MTTGIYQIFNKVNGKIYIGSAVNIETRWRQHKRYLNLGRHQNILLQRAWNKYWSTSFEFSILEICWAEELLNKEQSWLDWTNCCNVKFGYNLSPTAGNSLGVKHSEETRRRMSEAKKKVTTETRKLMSQNRKGKKLTEDHKAKISEGMKGRACSQETRDRISKSNKGRKLSKEQILQMSQRQLGKKLGKYKTKIDKLMETMTAPTIGY